MLNTITILLFIFFLFYYYYYYKINKPNTHTNHPLTFGKSLPLKPSNELLEMDTPKQKMKLTDFISIGDSVDDTDNGSDITSVATDIISKEIQN